MLFSSLFLESVFLFKHEMLLFTILALCFKNFEKKVEKNKATSIYEDIRGKKGESYQSLYWKAMFW